MNIFPLDTSKLCRTRRDVTTKQRDYIYETEPARHVPVGGYSKYEQEQPI